MTDLKHMAEFQEILANYHPSDEAIASLQGSPLVFLTAPSGVGRNTLINQLIKGDRFRDLVSDTTRPQRVNDGVLEQDGREYFFISEEQFLYGLKERKYLEAAIIHNSQVSGIRADTLDDIHVSGKIPICDIEIAGVNYYRSFKPDVVCVFVLPPDFKTWMHRLKERGEMAESEFRERMHSARAELEHALDHNYYHFMINDDIAKAVEDVENIIDGVNVEQRAHARKLAGSLLESVSQYLG